jgi:hypothetical protein
MRELKYSVNNPFTSMPATATISKIGDTTMMEKRMPDEPTTGQSGTKPMLTEEFTLDRTGQRPLRFKGTRIGFGTTKHHTSTEWINVTVYKTVGGSYIADVERVSLSQSESDVSEAFTCASPGELIAALHGDDGRLDRAAQAACEDAVKNDTDFMDAWAEVVP